MPLLTLVFLLAVTGAASYYTHAAVAGQEQRLLVERADEVNLVLTNSISSDTTEMSLLARDAAARGVASFDRQAEAIDTAPGTAVALVRLEPSGPVVLGEVGPGLRAGEVLSGPAAQAVTEAAAPVPSPAAGGAGGMAGLRATGVYPVGGVRSVGIALSGGGGLVVYRQTLIGAVRPPEDSAGAAFGDLDVVLYATARPDPAQVLVATTNHLVLSGAVRYVPLMVGSTRWLIAVAARSSLVGSSAAAAQWLTGAAGLVLAVLVCFLLETLARRRDAALAALEEEHRFAETLQRRLLPTLPKPRGVDVASSYVTGSDGQAVGGDWFDLFELPSGRIGVVIGDVMGHDVEAAAVMAQSRSALRAFASDGADPVAAVERLGTFLDTFAIPALVTVVYGVLDRPGPDGAWRFAWANAGHPPPLLRRPDGSVEELTGGLSPLLGAPAAGSRAGAERTLEAGCALLLYTDGLVEVEGQDLNANIAQLRDAFSATAARSAEGICQGVLDAQLPRRRRDDVAVLVLALVGDDLADESAAARMSVA